MSDDLNRLRSEIDSIDEEVLARLSRRAEIAHEIGLVKQGAAIYRPEREAQVLRRLTDMNKGPLSNETIFRLFREIMSACLALEQPLEIAYFGPAGTFTESAAKKHFGAAPNFNPLGSIDEVFRAVESGHANYGVVPVENSTEGAVGRTLDLLMQMPLMICGEVMLRIHQNLLSKAESLAEVKTIYSHAQSLGQCHEWLNHNMPHALRVPVASNAEAARMAAADPTTCAIAGEAAGALYGLNKLAQNIEDEPNNTTRFLVVGAHDAGVSGRDKTSLACATPNKPGAVHSLLEPLARHGVSMSKFESRPSRSSRFYSTQGASSGAGLWEYIFYVDIEGHRNEPHVVQALDELRERAAFVKVLGSYPSTAV